MCHFLKQVPTNSSCVIGTLQYTLLLCLTYSVTRIALVFYSVTLIVLVIFCNTDCTCVLFCNTNCSCVIFCNTDFTFVHILQYQLLLCHILQNPIDRSCVIHILQYQLLCSCIKQVLQYLQIALVFYFAIHILGRPWEQRCTQHRRTSSLTSWWKLSLLSGDTNFSKLYSSFSCFF